MQKMNCCITVFFENPFWVCVYERFEKNNISVCKVVFGKEPKDNEIYEYLLEHWNNLKFSNLIKKGFVDKSVHKNPKRVQREIKKQISSRGISTKAQESLRLQQKINKIEHVKRTKAFKEAEKNKRYELKKTKRKNKKKGK